MKDEIPKCSSCGQPMFEIGGIGKNIQIGDFTHDMGNGMKQWEQTGMREAKLYQCPECKDIKIQ